MKKMFGFLFCILFIIMNIVGSVYGCAHKDGFVFIAFIINLIVSVLLIVYAMSVDD